MASSLFCTYTDVTLLCTLRTTLNAVKHFNLWIVLLWPTWCKYSRCMCLLTSLYASGRMLHCKWTYYTTQRETGMEFRVCTRHSHHATMCDHYVISLPLVTLRH